MTKISQKDSLKLHLKLSVRDLVWMICNRHSRGPKPNIAVIGSRRSGTTLIRDAIAADSRLKYVDQPFSIFTSSAYQARLLPIRDCGQMVMPSEDEWKTISAYVDAIESGNLHVNEPWRVWEKTHGWSTDRIVFKITDATSLWRDLESRFSWHVVYVIRHPIAQSLSVMRLNRENSFSWQSRALGFLRNDEFCAVHLTDDQKKLCWKILGEGSELERFVLSWCMENLSFLRMTAKGCGPNYLTYEHAVMDHAATCFYLSQHLNLGNSDRIEQVLKKPSRSSAHTAEKRKKDIISGSKKDILEGWSKQLSVAEASRCFDLLEALDIRLYRRGEYSPETACKPLIN